MGKVSLSSIALMSLYTIFSINSNADPRESKNRKILRTKSFENAWQAMDERRTGYMLTSMHGEHIWAGMYV